MNKITVHITKDTLYDFLLFHAYSKFSGFLINILGMAIAFMGIILYVRGSITPLNTAFYLIAAVIFLGYTPLTLKMRAGRLVLSDKEYSTPAEYTFSEEEGITVEWEDMKREYKWDQIQRAVVTPKTIGIYYEAERAMIIPKQDFGEQFGEIFQMIARHLGMNNVRMR